MKPRRVFFLIGLPVAFVCVQFGRAQPHPPQAVPGAPASQAGGTSLPAMPSYVAGPAWTPWEGRSGDVRPQAYCSRFRPLAFSHSVSPRRRAARVAFDSDCARHDGETCVSVEANNPMAVPAVSCVDVQIFSGGTELAGEENHPFRCVVCPRQPGVTLVPAANVPDCNATDLAVANANQPIFDVNDTLLA